MLNIFRGKTDSPNYRLAVPTDGELQTIIVHEEVSREYWKERAAVLRGLDVKNSTIRVGLDFTKYKVHEGKI